jgi:hypothetical protein
MNRPTIHLLHRLIKSKRNVSLIAVVIAFGVIGGYLLISSKAASPFIVTESESSAPASMVVNDTVASGAKAVQFSATATPPPPPGSCDIPDRATVSTANKATYPAYPVGTKLYIPMGPDPWGGCFPGPGNTGVPAGTQLTNYTGACIITTANTVIDKKLVNCDLDIRAQGIVITNTQVNGRVYLDDTRCSTASFTISDSTLHVTDIGTRALMYCSYVATRVDLSGGGSMAECRHCTIKDSYLHTPLEDPTGKAHNSTVRIGEFANITHNTLWCNVRSIQSTDGSGESSGCSANQTGYSHDGIPPYNSTVSRNFYAAIPDGYCAYGGSTGGPGANQVHDVKLIQNIYQRGNMANDWKPTGAYICGYYGPVTSLDLSLPGNEFTGNTWDNGKPLSTEQNTWADYCGTQPGCTW